MRMRKRERERRVPPVRNGRQYIRRAGPGGYKMASLSGFFGARGSKRAEFTGNERNTNYIFGTESSLSSYSFFSPAPLSLSLSRCLPKTWFFILLLSNPLRGFLFMQCNQRKRQENTKYRDTHTYKSMKRLAGDVLWTWESEFPDGAG